MVNDGEADHTLASEPPAVLPISTRAQLNWTTISRNSSHDTHRTPNASNLLQKSGRERHNRKKVRSRGKESRHPRMQCRALEPQLSLSTSHGPVSFRTEPGPCTSGCDGFGLNRRTTPPRRVPCHRICRQLLLRYPISAARVVPILPLELTLQPNFANL